MNRSKKPTQIKKSRMSKRQLRLEQLEDRRLLFATAIHVDINNAALPFLNASVMQVINAQHAEEDAILNQTDSAAHFDNSAFREGAAKINEQYRAAVDASKPGSFNSLLVAEEFGKSLHATQDFYSHSNWVDMGLGTTYIAGGTDYWPSLRPYSTAAAGKAMIIQGENQNPTTKFGTATFNLNSQDLDSSGVPDHYVVDVTTSSGRTFLGVTSGSFLLADDTPDNIAVPHGNIPVISPGPGLAKDSPSADPQKNALYLRARRAATAQTFYEFYRITKLVERYNGVAAKDQLVNAWVKPDAASRSQYQKLVDIVEGKNKNLGQTSSGLSNSLDKQQQGTNSKALSTNLPIAGQSLQSSGPSSLGLNGTGSPKILDEFRVGLSNALQGKDTIDGIQEAIFSYLGPGGTFPYLGDTNSDGAIDRSDVEIVLTDLDGDETNGPEKFDFNILIEKPLTKVTETVAFDTGLPLLGLELNANVDLLLGFSFAMHFGVDPAGFYFDTNNSQDLKVDFKASVNNINATGRMGLLKLDATNDKNGSPTDFTGSFVIDFSDSGDGLLRSNENLNTTARLTGVASIQLDMTASFAGLTSSISFNPKVTADFNFRWTFSNEDTSIADRSRFGVLSVAFDDVKIDINEGLMKGFVSPLLKNIREITGPLQPIVNALKSKPLEKIGLNDTLLDILTKYLGISKSQTRFIEVVSEIVDLSNTASSRAASGSGTFIALGNFVLTDSRSNAPGLDPNGTVEKDGLSQLSAKDSGFSSILSKLNGGSLVVGAGQPGFDLQLLRNPQNIFKLFVNQPADLFVFRMPTLNIGTAAKKNIFSVPIPPFGPVVTLDFDIEGSIGLRGDLTVGFDSSGLVAFKSSPTQPDQLLKGFYIDSSNPLITIAGWDDVKKVVDEKAKILKFVASLNINSLPIQKFANDAGVELPDWIGDALSAGSPIKLEASFAAGIGLSGVLKVGLNGSSNRVRYADLGSTCIFNISGKIELGGDVKVTASASASVPYIEEVTEFVNKFTKKVFNREVIKDLSYSYDKTLYEFPTYTLFEFSAGGCPSGRADASTPPPQLAKLLPNGVLRLNVGEFVGGDVADGKRQIQPNEVNENFSVEHLGGDPSSPGGEDVRVLAFGVSDDFSGVKKIIGSFGSGRDTLTMNSQVLAESDIDGGSEEDILVAGSGTSRLSGGPGIDRLQGGSGNDVLLGGEEGDTLDGGPGNDKLTGDGGNDTILGGGGIDDQVIETRDTNWTLTAKTLTGNGTDTLSGVERAILTGGTSVNIFTVSGWSGNADLFGLGANDQYLITLQGAGTSTFTVSDSAGANDILNILGSQNGDDFVAKINSITNLSEIVNYSGIDDATIDARGGRDKVNVRETSVATPLRVLGGEGSDLVRVSTNAGINDDGSLDVINGDLTIDFGTGGANRLLISNFNGQKGFSYSIASQLDGFQQIFGLATGKIRFKVTGSPLDGLYELADSSILAGYDKLFGIVVRGSTKGNENATVYDTLGYATYKLEGNDGNDEFFVASTAQADDGNLDHILGPLTIWGGSGEDHVFVNDHGYTSSANYFVGPDKIIDLPSSLVTRTMDTLPQRLLFAGIFYDGTTELVRLDGTDSKNVFKMRPSFNTRFYLDGNALDVTNCLPQFADYLSLDLSPYANVDPQSVKDPNVTFTSIVNDQQRKGVWAFRDSHQNVEFENFEKFNYIDKLNISSDAAWTAQSGVGVESPYYADNYSRMVTNFTPSSIVPFAIDQFPTPVISGQDLLSNFLLPSDVNFDGSVSPLDALIVINYLNQRSGGSSGGSSSGFLDVNNDGYVSPLDALLVINTLNRGARPSVTFGGVRTTTADLNCDGVDEFIAVSGANHIPTLLIYNGITGRLMGSPQPLTATTDNFGTNVTAGDIDGDGKVEIITSSDRGPGTYSIWRWENGLLSKVADRTVAFSAGYLGGVRVATGDLNGDGKSEIIVGSGTGTDASVRAYNANGVQLSNFLVAPSFGRGGVYVATGDYNGDGRSDLFVSSGRRGNSQIQVFDGLASLGNSIASSRLISNAYTGQDAIAPISIALKDSDGDEEKELYSSQLSDGKSDQLKKWEYSNAADAFFSTLQSDLDPDWSSGAYLG